MFHCIKWYNCQEVVSQYLQDSGFTTTSAYDGIEGIMNYSSDIDLIICDVMMPRMDGYQVVEEVRKNSEVPIIMLTALSEEDDVLKGYDLGVDEYVSKPFSPKIIVKKVHAILNRHQQQASQEIIHKGGICLDQPRMSVSINNNTVSLSKKEYELLALFMDNESIVFTRDNLLNKLWGYDYFGDDRVVDTCIKRLRKKISPAHKHIKTVFGTGYKFEVDNENI